MFNIKNLPNIYMTIEKYTSYDLGKINIRKNNRLKVIKYAILQARG